MPDLSLLADPLTLLLLLWAASALARRFVTGAGDSPFASGGIVMAGGIFVVAALGELPVPGWTGRLVALELIVVWSYIALSYARSALRGGLLERVSEPANTFAIGTWVAASAVLGRALVEALPEWRPLALALWIAAAALWLWYVRLLPAAFRAAADPSGGYLANGAILLSAVATQSLVVSGDAVIGGGLPGMVSAALIASGYLLYVAGLALIARRYLLQRGWTLAENWDDTNCILHGAMSISGLAVVQSGALPASFAVVTWVWVVAAFAVVEGVELARACSRLRAYGWREGLLSYYVSQWSRNFTFGMFYAFTLQLYESPAPDAWVSGLHRAIVDYGHYAVAAALAAEMCLFLCRRGTFSAKMV